MEIHHNTFWVFTTRREKFEQSKLKYIQDVVSQ